MKFVNIILFLTFLIPSEYSDKYYQYMETGIKMFESSKTEEDFLKTISEQIPGVTFSTDEIIWTVAKSCILFHKTCCNNAAGTT